MPDEPTDEQIDAFDEAKELVLISLDLSRERFQSKKEVFDEIGRVATQAYEEACARRGIEVDPEQINLLQLQVVLSLRFDPEFDFSWVDDLEENKDALPVLTEKEELLAIISALIAADPVFRESGDPKAQAGRAFVILKRLAADHGIEITSEDRMLLACDVILMWGGNFINRRGKPE
jgi:hypothetical protein